MKIPKSFKLFSATINVVFDNKRNHDANSYGLSEYSESKITLSNVHGIDTLSDDRMLDCFYHEKIHMILDSMHERDLSTNEKFVDIFAKLLRQADETAIF